MLKRVIAEFEVDVPENMTEMHMLALTKDYISINRFVSIVHKVTFYPPDYILHVFGSVSPDSETKQ